MGERFEDGFSDRVAVVTGGGTGMGRALVRQLAADGCDVALCDVSAETMEETRGLVVADGSSGEVLTHVADVSDEDQVLAFAAAVAGWRPHVNLLFNNAGIGGGGTIINGDREQWEKCFNICWFGVYYNTLAFLPQMMEADVGHVVNTSSVNGFFASIGPGFPHTAYSAAKFAVKGFTEALITDFQINAPHLRASVVMPGHIGTSIATNSDKLLGMDDVERLRQRYADAGKDASTMSDEELLARMERRGQAFIDSAPMTAAEAAGVILDAVKTETWRVLVGHDAEIIDRMVRNEPTSAYTRGFFRQWVEESAVGR